MKESDKWRNNARKKKKQIQVFLTQEEYEIVEKAKKDNEISNNKRLFLFLLGKYLYEK